MATNKPKNRTHQEAVDEAVDWIRRCEEAGNHVVAYIRGSRQMGYHHVADPSKEECSRLIDISDGGLKALPIPTAGALK
jgi:hypothetical protein